MDAYAFSSWPTELTALLDWSGVPLVLSTGQPLGQTQGSLPRPWTVDVQREPPAKPIAIDMAPRLRRWAAPRRWRRRPFSRPGSFTCCSTPKTTRTTGSS